ncbi:hypothetical protein COLO4_09245 [Corchorus olitorius]|uniref:Uncharacterized protein n=1 Tax=Corchorus olitorius TaxID=93759 RepID=A0A1R3KCL7_9ROSI|nr:hypothetical protein COLO4_09245 [Corchorus olitorius]
MILELSISKKMKSKRDEAMARLKSRDGDDLAWPLIALLSGKNPSSDFDHFLLNSAYCSVLVSTLTLHHLQLI